MPTIVAPLTHAGACGGGDDEGDDASGGSTTTTAASSATTRTGLTTKDDPWRTTAMPFRTKAGETFTDDGSFTFPEDQPSG